MTKQTKRFWEHGSHPDDERRNDDFWLNETIPQGEQRTIGQLHQDELLASQADVLDSRGVRRVYRRFVGQRQVLERRPNRRMRQIGAAAVAGLLVLVGGAGVVNATTERPHAHPATFDAVHPDTLRQILQRPRLLEALGWCEKDLRLQAQLEERYAAAVPPEEIHGVHQDRSQIFQRAAVLAKAHSVPCLPDADIDPQIVLRGLPAPEDPNGSSTHPYPDTFLPQNVVRFDASSAETLCKDQARAKHYVRYASNHDLEDLYYQQNAAIAGAAASGLGGVCTSATD